MNTEEQDEAEITIPIDEHEEVISEDGKEIRRRGVYLLPNLFTLAALFAGFYGVIAGMSEILMKPAGRYLLLVFVMVWMAGSLV